MKIKARLLGEKINSDDMLISAKNLQLTTQIYSEQLPVNKDIGIMTILENFDDKKNNFYVILKNYKNEEIGKGNIFRLKIATKGKEAIVIYNINNLTFNKKEDYYIVELWNNGQLFDMYKLSCEVEIYNIYENTFSKGWINL